MPKKKRSPGGTPATALLDASGVAYRALPYEHDPRADSYGLEAAAALGVEPSRVFKTLLAQTEDLLIVAVVPVSGLLDLKALAAAARAKKATMADTADAQRSTGYVVGGISPLGQRRLLPTFLDFTARNFETILVSGGKRGLDVELRPQDLLALTNGCYASIGKD